MNKIQKHIAESEKLFNKEFYNIFKQNGHRVNSEIIRRRIKDFLKQRELALVERIKEIAEKKKWDTDIEKYDDFSKSVIVARHNKDIDDIKLLLDNTN